MVICDRCSLVVSPSKSANGTSTLTQLPVTSSGGRMTTSSSTSSMASTVTIPFRASIAARSQPVDSSVSAPL